MLIGLKKIILIISLIVLSACNNGYIRKNSAIQLTPSGPAPEAEPAPLRSEEITFQMVQNKVLNQSCLMCHSKAGGNKGGVNLETYQDVQVHKDVIRDEVVTGGMPLSPVHPLTAEQSNLIISWIDAGAREF